MYFLCRESEDNSFQRLAKSEAALQRCTLEKKFGKYAANLHKSIYPKVRFWYGFWYGCFISLLDIFRTPQPKKTSGGLLLKNAKIIMKKMTILFKLQRFITIFA